MFLRLQMGNKNISVSNFINFIFAGVNSEKCDFMNFQICENFFGLQRRRHINGLLTLVAKKKEYR